MLERSALFPATTTEPATTADLGADTDTEPDTGTDGSPAAASSVPVAPRLADGVVLLGEYQDSGFTEPHYLVIRSDGQVLHVSRLLHVVASAMEKLAEQDSQDDGDTDDDFADADLDELAAAVSTEYGRTLTTEGLTFLIEERLRPMGLIAPPTARQGATAAGEASPTDLAEAPAAAATTTTPAPTASPLLALRLRRTLVSATWTRRVARVLAPLFNPVVVVVAITALVASDIWLVRTAMVTSATAAALDMPVLLLGLFAILLVSTLFHEFGHAAACHRGGASPGAIGVALYVVYPAFYTDVTASYQLSRRGRLRTDLGGVYFNALSLLALTGVYAGTHYAPLLLAIVVVHVEMLQQLMPIARLDGYFVVADLVGVPDLFGRVRPIVASLVPWRPTSPRVRELRLRARVVVTLWVLIAMPVMLGAFALLLVRTPEMAVSIWAAEQEQWQRLVAAAAAVDPAAAALAGLSMFLLPLPLVGLGLLLGGMARLLADRAGARLRGHTARGSHRVSHRPQEVTMSGSKPAPVLPMMEPTTQTDTASPPAGPPPAASPGLSSPSESTGIAAREAIVARSAADFTEEAMLRPSSRPPARGWRRGVYAATRGGVNLGPGAAERREIDLLGRVRTPVRGCRRIVVISRKGGAGKTTTTLMLGHTLAMYRGDRVVALDANPDAGSLAHRMRRETPATVTNLLEEREFIQRYADMRGFTSQSPDTRLEVVASDDDPRITQALGEEDYRRAIGVLDRHYNLVLVDTGTGILDSAIQGILAEADQVVVVMPPALDGARVAAMTLDWLEEHHHGDLVRGAVAVVNAVHGAGQLEIARIEDHFAARCRAVVRIPWDPVLQAGAHTSLADLGQASRDAYLELAAAVAEPFGQETRSERAPWGGTR
jgi:putative peptide zinc metalloprotease protein